MLLTLGASHSTAENTGAVMHLHGTVGVGIFSVTNIPKKLGLTPFIIVVYMRDIAIQRSWVFILWSTAT